MDKLPKLRDEVPEPTAQEIFETNPNHVGKDSVEKEAESTDQSTDQLEMIANPEAATPKKSRKKYTRDPEDLKNHMKMMREKAAEARQKRKEAAQPEREEAPVQTRNKSYEEAFGQFMDFYAIAEQAKAERQKEIDAEVQRQIRAEKKKRPKTQPRPRRKKFYPGVNAPLDAGRRDGKFDLTAPSSVYTMYNGYRQGMGFQ